MSTDRLPIQGTDEIDAIREAFLAEIEQRPPVDAPFQLRFAEDTQQSSRIDQLKETHEKSQEAPEGILTKGESELAYIMDTLGKLDFAKVMRRRTASNNDNAATVNRSLIEYWLEDVVAGVSMDVAAGTKSALAPFAALGAAVGDKLTPAADAVFDQYVRHREAVNKGLVTAATAGVLVTGAVTGDHDKAVDEVGAEDTSIVSGITPERVAHRTIITVPGLDSETQDPAKSAQDAQDFFNDRDNAEVPEVTIEGDRLILSREVSDDEAIGAALRAIRQENPDLTASVDSPTSEAPVDEQAVQQLNSPEANLTPLQQRIITEAEKYVGITEDPDTPNHSPEIDEYFQNGLTGANAQWCASFISRVFKDSGIPFTGGDQDGHKGPEWQIEFVNNVYRWARDNGGQIFGHQDISNGFVPQPGDLAIYNEEGKFDDSRSGVNHIGLVVGYDENLNFVELIEGNYKNGVNRRRYDPTIKINDPGRALAGFVRVPALVNGLLEPVSPSPTSPEDQTLPDRLSQEQAEAIGLDWEIAQHIRATENFTIAEILAQLHTESKFDPNAVSPAGAMGLGQFMPATEAEWIRDVDGNGRASAFDVQDNLDGNRRYMEYLHDYVEEKIGEGKVQGDTDELAWAAYNAGQGNVVKYGGIPDFEETQNYVERINKKAAEYTGILRETTPAVENPTPEEQAPVEPSVPETTTTTQAITEETSTTTTETEEVNPETAEANNEQLSEERGTAWISYDAALNAFRIYFYDESGALDEAALQEWVDNLDVNEEGKVRVNIYETPDAQ